MKTPRELLLSRHETVVPKLNALRRRVVAEHVMGIADGEIIAPRQALGARLWQELFWSSRWAWLALGSCWLVIAPLHFAAREPASARSGVAEETVVLPLTNPLLAEQQQLRAELLGTLPTPAASSLSPARLPPRSGFGGPFPSA